MLSPKQCFLTSKRCSSCHIDRLYHYVIVRNDLPDGFIAAQIVHAAGESTPHNLPPGTYAVVLSVDSETELAAIGDRLRKADIPHVYINEPDPPYFGQLTAIGIVPTTDRQKLKRVLGRLRLYTGEENKIGAAV